MFLFFVANSSPKFCCFQDFSAEGSLEVRWSHSLLFSDFYISAHGTNTPALSLQIDTCPKATPFSLMTNSPTQTALPQAFAIVLLGFRYDFYISKAQ